MDLAEGLPVDHRQPGGRRGDTDAGALQADHGQRPAELQVRESLIFKTTHRRSVTLDGLSQLVDSSSDVRQRQLQRGTRVQADVHLEDQVR